MDRLKAGVLPLNMGREVSMPAAQHGLSPYKEKVALFFSFHEKSFIDEQK
jgi:hypothetical protein